MYQGAILLSSPTVGSSLRLFLYLVAVNAEVLQSYKVVSKQISDIADLLCWEQKAEEINPTV